MKKKTRRQKLVIALPAFVEVADYHEGKYVKELLEQLGVHARVKEMGINDETGMYIFKVD